MPIGGVVISALPREVEQVAEACGAMAGVEIHGLDDKGNIVAVLDTRTTDEMEELMRSIGRRPGVLQVGLTYLNSEDEDAMMARGEYVPQVLGRRKGEREPR